MFKVRNKSLRGLIAAWLCMNTGFFIATYVNDIMQYPNQLPVYIGFALCFAAPHIDKRMSEKVKKKSNIYSITKPTETRMTTNIPDISFITICYNGFKDTCELIESLHKKLKSVSYEIIVVDNASREDEATKIRELYPTVISIRSNENGGFSGGNNIGIRIAKGKYIFLINNDTYIESDEVACLVERLESRPEIGGVSPKIRFAFPPQHIQFAGFTPLTKITLRNNILGFDCPDDGSYDTPHPTPICMGQL